MALVDLYFYLTVLFVLSQAMTPESLLISCHERHLPLMNYPNNVHRFCNFAPTAQALLKGKASTQSGKKDYSGYKVLRVIPPDSSSHKFLKSLTNQYDFWKESRGVGHSADILISGDEHPLLVSKLKERGFDVMTIIDDVKPLIDDQMKMKRTRASEFYYIQYHRLGEIIHWINDFTAENRNLVAKKKILDTYQGRHVYKLKISSDLTNRTRPIFFMIGGTHAREWITPATMMYVADFLVSSYDPGRTDNLIDIMEFNIVPVFNQDGYRYSWKSDRMWRKTRNRNPGFRCIGTDPNRNFDIHWGTGGSSDRPCREIYMGSSPNSTVEVRSMQDHVFSIKDRVKVFIDVHSYGQFWMYPYGYSSIKLPDDEVELRAASQAAVDAIKAVHGEVYENGPTSRYYDITSGSSGDWAYDVAGIKHSYSLELRDKGTDGFFLSKYKIKPTAEEFFAGCKAVVKYLKDNNGL